MKLRWMILWMLLAALLLAGCAVEETPGAYSGTLVLEGEHVYESGQTLNGGMLVLDGSVLLQEGAGVEGSLFLINGRVEIRGFVEGDVAVFGGKLTLGPSAVIGGDLRVGAGDLERSPQATIEGRTLIGAASGLQPADVFPERSLQDELLRLIPEALILGLLAGLAARFIPGFVARVQEAAVHHPVVSTAVGLLAAIVGLTVLVMIAYTLILIPVSFLGLVIGVLAVLYGWIGIGLDLGQRLAAWRGWDLSRFWIAFLGAAIFSLLLNLVNLIPFVGGVVGILLISLAIGAVLLTRFGLRRFIPEMEAGEY